MAHDPAALLPVSSSSNRRLKLLVGVLVISNLLLGCLSAYLLRSLDRNYSGLIDRGIPVLQEVRQLTKETVSMQRQALATMVAAEPVARREATQRLQVAIARQKNSLARLLQSDALVARPELSKTLRQSSQSYESDLATFLVHLEAGRRDEADKLRVESLRPSVNSYLDVIDEAAVAVETNGKEMTGLISDRVRTQSTILVGLASWPLLVGLVIVVLIGLIIGLLVFIYRQVGTEQY